MGIGSLLRRTQAEAEPQDAESEERTEGIVGTRRNLFKLLGIGAAGAVGASLIESSPAGADDGDSLLLGNDAWASDVDTNNLAFTNTTLAFGLLEQGYSYPGLTVISVNTPEAANNNASIEATDNPNSGDTGGNLVGQDVSFGTGPGLWAHLDNASNESAAVLAQTAGGGPAVRGISVAGSGISYTAGVVGDSDSNDGVTGLSSYNNGVSGFITGNAHNGVYGADNTTGGHCGVRGFSNAGTGVYGQNGVTSSDQSAVYGDDQSTSGGYGVQGHTNTGVGVFGEVVGTSGFGVYGLDDSSGGGVGVIGDSAHGVGVSAQTTSGTALQVAGKATFTRSGVTTVATAGTSVTTAAVSGGLTSASHVLATLQSDSGTATLAIHAAVPDTADGKITIHFTGSAPVGTKVAWFVFG